MSDFEIPKPWQAQCERWTQIYGQSAVCIAGGALRDLDHGLPIKDVDIFVQLGNRPVPKREDLTGMLDGFNPQLVLDREYMGLDKHPNRITQEVSLVWEYRVNETLYNVIFLTETYTPEAFMLRLDFGLSRIAWWPVGDGVQRHVTYLEDKDARQFKVRRCENVDQLQRSHDRGRRLIARNFQGYALVLPRVVDLPLVEI